MYADDHDHSGEVHRLGYGHDVAVGDALILVERSQYEIPARRDEYRIFRIFARLHGI